MASETLADVSFDQFQALFDEVAELKEKVENILKDLEADKAAAGTGGRNRDAQREMTEEDAREIMFGEAAQLKHNEAAKKLGLSYGQVYSCRLGYTFKGIHKEMKESNIKNPWIKEA